MKKIANWIWSDNLRPFVDVLAWLCEYDLADGEWDTISHGVNESDSDATPERWYEYEFHGSGVVRFRMARDSGTNVLNVHLDVADSLGEKIGLALDLMNQYRLEK